MISDVWVSKQPMFALQLEQGALPEQPQGWVLFIDETPDTLGLHQCRYVFLDLDGGRREFRAEQPPRKWQDMFVPIAS